LKLIFAAGDLLSVPGGSLFSSILLYCFFILPFAEINLIRESQ
jgi:hypothetical protein